MQFQDADHELASEVRKAPHADLDKEQNEFSLGVLLSSWKQ